MTGALNKLTRFRFRLNGLPRDAGWYFGLDTSGLKSATGARILVYHGICKTDHLRFNTLFVKLKTFETQLRFYKKYFTIVSLDDFYQQRFSKEKFNLCLTFDDGFANNYKYVLPLLEQYEVPATFFITGIREAGYDILWNDVLAIAYRHGPSTFSFQKEKFTRNKDGKYISSAGEYLVDILRSADFESKAEMMKILGHFKNKADDDYWLQMTREQIKDLSRSKWVTIGSHSYYHNDLATMKEEAVNTDIARSKQYLENLTDREIRALAFPYGSYSSKVIRRAKESGFTQLLAGKFHFPGDINEPALRERFTVNPFISNINQMHANVTGTYR